MSNRVSPYIKAKILEMPEYRMGTNKVRVILKDGGRFSAVFVAWGEEIVKVGSSTVIPFEAEDIVEVENDS
jgi:hypothetical protein